jgi:Domain of unknown function (DUF5658)
MYRFAFLPRVRAGRSGCAYVLVCCLWCVAPARAGAQDAAAAPSADTVPITTLAEATAGPALGHPADAPPPQLSVPVPVRTPPRPASLMPLYVSFASLQVMDIHSTTRALDRGAVEANPLMKGIAGNPVALSAMKVAGSAGVIYAAEKMWKRNRTAAVLFMVAANAGMAFVVQHNYRVK